jgi:hypothetical protein
MDIDELLPAEGVEPPLAVVLLVHPAASSAAAVTEMVIVVSLLVLVVSRVMIGPLPLVVGAGFSGVRAWPHAADVELEVRGSRRRAG